jgi:subtilase family serine protease
MRLGRARLLAIAAATTTMAGAVAAVALPSSAATAAPTVALTSSVAPAAPAGSVRLGALSAATEIHVDVGLNLGNEPGLNALLNGLANPKSPYYRDFLGKGQFGPMFGLSLAQIGQVSATLKSLGLDPGPVDSGRLLIPVTATAAQLEHAFGVSLVDYRLPGGRVAYANTAAPKIPATIAGYVEGVVGLDDLAQPQHMSAPVSTPAKPADRQASAATATSVPAAMRTDLPVTPAASAAKGPQACTAATGTAVADGGYTANELAEHYGLNGLYAMGDLGAGVHVAVAELEPNLSTDISAYESCYGITTPVSYINVDGGAGTGDGSGEAALDIENIAGLAPDVVIDDYEAPNTSGMSLFDIATAVADKDQDQVLSISWGLCETEAGSALLTDYANVWKELDADGITVASAAGDAGSTDCYEPGAATSSDALAVSSPASTPYGLAVGGTTLTSETELSTETAWNGTGTANAGAGGGGLSALFCMPEYQDYHQVSSSYQAITGLISADSKTNAGCKDSTDPKGYVRQVPDISADAAGSSPYIVYYDGAWEGVYGTSASTGLIAASAALIDSSPYCSAKGWSSGKVGLLPQGLYLMMSASNASNLVYSDGEGILQDVTSGNNDDTASGYTGGLYPATKGYDMATGLGVPLLSGLYGLTSFNPSVTSNMCHLFAAKGVDKVSTSSVSPRYGKAGKATTVTIKGSGFLVVPDTDVVDVNTNNNTKQVAMVYASCSSHAVCKATIPAEKAGTYELEMVVVRWLPCASGCKIDVKFIVSGPPKITKISPAHGGKGTKVTIRGSNFYGVSAVYFGSRKATSVKVISATEITAVAPAGSGKQAVKVVAVGGTTNKLTFTY